MASATVVYGIPISSPNDAALARRVMHLSIAAAILTVIQFFINVGTSDGAATRIEASVVSLAFSLIVPCCGYYGVKNRHRDMVWWFSCCNACSAAIMSLTVVATVFAAGVLALGRPGGGRAAGGSMINPACGNYTYITQSGVIGTCDNCIAKNGTATGFTSCERMAITGVTIVTIILLIVACVLSCMSCVNGKRLYNSPTMFIAPNRAIVPTAAVMGQPVNPAQYQAAAGYGQQPYGYVQAGQPTGQPMYGQAPPGYTGYGQPSPTAPYQEVPMAQPFGQPSAGYYPSYAQAPPPTALPYDQAAPGAQPPQAAKFVSM